MSIERHRQQGFSIVEALVALVVLAVGMLGIAGLYVTSLRAGSSALLRTQAVNLAADMADRIRANPTAGLAYAGAPATAPNGNNCAGAAPATCTPAQLAADDLFRWERQLVNVLPDTDGNAATPQWAIAVQGANRPRTYTITINWREPGHDQADLTYALVLQI